MWGKRGPTLATELGLWLIRKPALGTRHPEGCAAFVTKLQTLWILKATARAVHGCTLRLNRASGWVARAGAVTRAIDMGVWDYCVSTPGRARSQVKSTRRLQMLEWRRADR